MMSQVSFAVSMIAVLNKVVRMTKTRSCSVLRDDIPSFRGRNVGRSFDLEAVGSWLSFKCYSL